MSCLNPPLIRKPSKGFAWQCAFCTRQEIYSDPGTPIVSKSIAITKDTTPESNTIQPEQQQPQSSKSSKSDSKRQLRATRSQVLKPIVTPIQTQKPETSIKLKINQKKTGPKSKSIGAKKIPAVI